MQNPSLAVIGAGEFGRRYIQNLSEISGFTHRHCDEATLHEAIGRVGRAMEAA